MGESSSLTYGVRAPDSNCAAPLLHWTEWQGKNMGQLRFAFGSGWGEAKRIAGSGLSEVAIPKPSALTYFPIELLHIFCVPHNYIVVYHLCCEYLEVLLRPTVLTKRDGQRRLITLIHSSFPLWGTENCFCHFSRGAVF